VSRRSQEEEKAEEKAHYSVTSDAASRANHCGRSSLDWSDLRKKINHESPKPRTSKYCKNRSCNAEDEDIYGGASVSYFFSG